jgi:hypothetical protein
MILTLSVQENCEASGIRDYGVVSNKVLPNSNFTADLANLDDLNGTGQPRNALLNQDQDDSLTII